MHAEELVRRFESCDLPADHFHHREHVQVAWMYLTRYDLLEALGRFTAGLKRLASHYGAPDKYHETITWSFMFLVHERMQRAGAAMHDWSTFAGRNPDLFEWPSSLLYRYYAAETLASPAARRRFVMPDRSSPADHRTSREPPISRR